MRRPIGIAAAILLLAGCGTASTTSTAMSGQDPDAGEWSRAAAFPLSARTDPIVAWTGAEVIVAGGNEGFVCPPNADCTFPDQLAVDGAAYDPGTDTWRRIADLPLPLYSPGSAFTAYVGGLVVVHAPWPDKVWLSYDPAADRWARLRPPGPGFPDLVGAGPDRVWGVDGDAIVSWDPVTGRVVRERDYRPEHPLDDLRVLATDLGPVVTGVDYDAAAPDEPTLAQVDLPDGTGWRRVVTGQIGWFSTWTGTRIAGYEAWGADGGEVNGWDRWYPGAGAVDVTTGEWSEVDVPSPGPFDVDPDEAPWKVEAFDGPRIVSAGHFVDDRVGRWVEIGRPRASDLDLNLSARWAGERLFVFGGADEAAGYEGPAGPEAWLWTPPSG